ncbi:MAG: carotenoid biosynthesis protein [Patescibacteria group bacterium]|jgi:putative membrane protein
MLPTQKNVLWFMGLLAFSLVMNVIALKTGFPYGYFWYGSGWGLAILQVPLLFVLGFPLVFAGATALANRAGVPRGLPFMLTVALVLLAVDLIVEPGAVAEGLWAFRNGGEYLNVPVANFVGILFTGSLAAFVLPNNLRSEKAVALLLIFVALATLQSIRHGLIMPAIFGLLFVLAISWFDLKRHGWTSGN